MRACVRPSLPLSVPPSVRLSHPFLPSFLPSFIYYCFTIFCVMHRYFTCKLITDAVQKVFYLTRLSMTFSPTYKLFINCTEISFYLNWKQGWKNGIYQLFLLNLIWTYKINIKWILNETKDTGPLAVTFSETDSKLLSQGLKKNIPNSSAGLFGKWVL